jgi:hypothetical protein
MLKEQMNATLSRSDVLKPLAWLIGILALSIALFLYAKAPGWLVATLGVSFIVAIFLYFACYLYCLMNDRDALRSEKYSINKMAIEHGVYGDNNSGVISLPSSESLSLPAPDIPKENAGEV